MAAVGVFAKKSYEGASLADLTAAMGINRFSMYATFGNKEALYVKAMEAYNEVRRRRIVELLTGESAREAIDHMLRDIVTRFTESAHGVCFVTQGPLSPEEASEETRQLMARRRSEVEEAIRKRLESAIEQGEIPSDISAADHARYFAVIIQGIALQAQHGGTCEELMRAVDVVMSSWPPRPERDRAAKSSSS